MGANYLATTIGISVSPILVLQKFSGILLSSVSDINSSYHDKSIGT